ncbi:hypothetical protein [Desulfovibrio litoralis]|uniref:Antibiotic biosynthesis monooxygenase n=1 Tax=Desulfovibrio litoralis DSM 11393 TaxID=1121455 RepID=A0A1M7T5P9_9BACT|nr:hypothetical protein [Desulfovibrio litoralis]SHN66056.1 hypothetical protein SAMN02745728_01571 [Desulfovibrio litoralis DSM 11393]
MISRTWHGVVPVTQRNAFKEYLDQTGVKEAIEIDGNLGAYIQIADQNEYSHFFLCTIWNTWEDILLYAGKTPYIAITYPEDQRFGLISDPIVIHQKVYTCENPFIEKALW